MKLIRKAGATSNIFQVFIRDSSSSTGAGLSGLVFNTASLTAYYHRDTDTTATAITLVTMTLGTYTSGGFKEIDATNMPGWYQFCPPDAAIAASAKNCAFHLKGAANMAPLPLEVQLVAYDPDDSVHLGLTALPNAAAAASGGLLISGSNSGTTTFGAITCTGNFTISDGLILNRSTLNASAIVATGNGTGHGADFQSGSGASGSGINSASNATNGSGMAVTGKGNGGGFFASGGASGSGAGARFSGGGLSGDGIQCSAPASGHGISATAIGTSKHGINAVGAAAVSINPAGNGINATGGAASTNSGGVAASGIKIIGGAGAASTNGSASGIAVTAGGTTTVSGNDAAIFTATGNGNGVTLTGAGSGIDLNANSNALTISTVTNLTNAPTNGDFTAAMKTSLNAATPASVVGAVGSVTGNVGGNVTGSVGSIATGGITAASIAASALNGKGDWNIGKTGYALSAAGVQAIWDALTSALTTVGSIGKLLVDNINATISSRLASAGYTVPPTASTIAGAVWDETLASHLASGSTGAALNAAGAAGDPWSTALPGVYGAGTAGKIIGDNINAAISSRMATYSQPTGFLAATFPGTVASPTNITSASGVALTSAYNAAKTAAQPGDAMSISTAGLARMFTQDSGETFGVAVAGSVVAEIADNAAGGGLTVQSIVNGVWNETLSSHLTSGSTGAALNAAETDSWSIALPGAYGAGTAGNIVGNKLDAAISSRLASSGYTAPLDAAGTRSAVGLASANLDSQLAAISISTDDAAVIGFANAGG